MQHSFCIIGNGGATPSVNKLALVSGKLSVTSLSGFPPGQSVYRVAVSPSGSIVAAATKNGDIKVFRLQDDNVTFISDFQYRTAQSPHVTGLSFTDDNILLASGTDSKVRVLNILSRERHKLLSLPGIPFGLTAVNSEMLAFICRVAGNDHLMVWNLGTEEKIFEGPAFKINAEYLMAPLAMDDESAYLAHSDRYGNAYFYKIDEGYSLKSFDTGHGDFYGLIVSKGVAITGGYKDNGRIRRWTLDSDIKYSEAPPLQSPILSLSKFDASSFISVSAQGAIFLYNYNNMEIRQKTQLNNLRHVAALPASLLINIHKIERSEFLQSVVDRIRELYENGRDDDARNLILSLEDEGYDIEALKILAIAEKAKGLLLGEIELLLMLLQKNPHGEEYFEILKRLAELFEQIHEPEMAIHTLETLSGESGDREPYASQIQTLRTRCIPDSAQFTLLTGFPSVDMIKPEFRKAELLGKFFQSAIAWEPEIFSSKLTRALELDEINNYLSERKYDLIESKGLIPVYFKAGTTVAGPVDILRLVPKLPVHQYIELWVEVRKGIDDSKLLFHHIFYPHAKEYSERWNYEMLDFFEKAVSGGAVKEWIEKAERVIRTIIVSLEHNDDEDDMFKIHASR